MKAIAGLSEQQDRDLACAPVFCFVSEEQCSVTAGCSPLQSSGSNWPELAVACEQQRRPRRRCLSQGPGEARVRAGAGRLRLATRRACLTSSQGARGGVKGLIPTDAPRHSAYELSR